MLASTFTKLTTKTKLSTGLIASVRNFSSQQVRISSLPGPNLE